ncbi:MAG: Stage sporulation protein [Acidimicrobiales bacterium]|nr:Stage sporulation protein [Acidimicrobiales bacterium]
MTSSRSTGEWAAVLRQQEAVARLGQRGLQGIALDALLSEAAQIVAETLEADDAILLELLPSWRELRVRAAVHHGRPVPQQFLLDVLIPAGRASQAGYTLMLGAPVVCNDLQAEQRFTPAADRHAVPVRAGVTAMIGWEDQPWGVLGANCEAVRNWTSDEVRFLQSIGNVIGLAIQRQRIEDELRESNARLDLSLAVGGLGTWMWDRADDRMQLSGALERLTGVGDYRGTLGHFLEIVHPDDRDALRVAANEAFDGPGELSVSYRVRTAEGEIRWIEARGRLVADAIGPPHRMVGVATDITERRMVDEMKESLLAREHQARLAAEAARERVAFLAAASASLSASLDPAVTLESLARLLVPHLCDVCFIDLLDEEGRLVEAAAGHHDADALALVRELRRRRSALGDQGGIWSGQRVALTGEAEMVADIRDEDYRRVTDDPQHLQLMRRFGARSGAAVPLVARGRVLGVLTLICVGERRRFSAEDLPLVEDLGRRAAMAVDNARLYESRNRVARTLQRSLLPPALPTIAGIEVAARYRVAEAETEIGGDFYDVFEVSDGAWAVVIGDVCGRGPEAAAITGLMRHSVRAAAVHESRPSRILSQTNEAVLGQIDDTRFCTAAMLRLHPPGLRGRSARITASSGGHPRPLVVHPDGRVEWIDCAGTLLGVLPKPTLVDATVVLPRGSSVVLFTDGVTEARRGPEQFGESRLIEALSSGAELSAEALAARIEAAVADFQDHGNDDLAVLVVRVAP